VCIYLLPASAPASSPTREGIGAAVVTDEQIDVATTWLEDRSTQVAIGPTTKLKVDYQLAGLAADILGGMFADPKANLENSQVVRLYLIEVEDWTVENANWYYRDLLGEDAVAYARAILNASAN
jgi:hypothetical protein